MTQRNNPHPPLSVYLTAEVLQHDGVTHTHSVALRIDGQPRSATSFGEVRHLRHTDTLSQRERDKHRNGSTTQTAAAAAVETAECENTEKENHHEWAETHQCEMGPIRSHEKGIESV